MTRMLPMDRYEELAHEIIDEVSEVVEEHYTVKPREFDEGSGLENPALINGTAYFDLEARIAERIRKIAKAVREPRGGGSR